MGSELLHFGFHITYALDNSRTNYTLNRRRFITRSSFKKLQYTVTENRIKSDNGNDEKKFEKNYCEQDQKNCENLLEHKKSIKNATGTPTATTTTTKSNKPIDTSPRIISLERKKCFKKYPDFHENYKTLNENYRKTLNQTEKVLETKTNNTKSDCMPDIVISSIRSSENFKNNSSDVDWSVKDKISFFNTLALRSSQKLSIKNKSKHLKRVPSVKSTKLTNYKKFHTINTILPREKNSENSADSPKAKGSKSSTDSKFDCKNTTNELLLPHNKFVKSNIQKFEKNFGANEIKTTSLPPYSKDIPKNENFVKSRIAEFELFFQEKTKITEL